MLSEEAQNKPFSIMFCCRDLDSKITRRESAAVSEFVQSGAGIHSMRDNPYHDNPMMGGSWGSNLEAANIREMWKSSWRKIMNDKLAFSSRKTKGPDQTLLTRHIWPWGRNMSLQHDSYLSARNTRDQSLFFIVLYCQIYNTKYYGFSVSLSTIQSKLICLDVI